MVTVESVIERVFGNDAATADALGVGRTAVSNWKAWGYFPSRLAVPIWKHARERGIEIGVDQIPVMPVKAAAHR